MLGELAGEDEADGSLDLAGGHGLLLVVLAELTGLRRDAPEGVGHEGVEDAHGALGDAGVRVELLEHLVDVDVPRLARLPAVWLSCWTSDHLELVVS